jgi:putative ABC transport system substrate-binding protein
MKVRNRHQAAGDIRKARIACFAFSALLVALSPPAEVQPAKKMARIGYLSGRSGPFEPLAAFKEGLRELGWVEGKQIEIEYRYGGNNVGKLSEFATELVRLKVDVIVAGPGNEATFAVKRATTTIPIVMVGVVDPVSSGLIASIARPGGNITGVTYEVTREQAGKNLELLKDAVPRVSRVAILRNANDPTHASYSKEAEKTAKIIGVSIKFAEMQTRNEKTLQNTLDVVVSERANALLVTPDTFFADHRRRIIDFVARNKLPAIYFGSGFVDDGGLMSYGPDRGYMWRRLGFYVDKLLNGTKPADLPVEQPKKLELIINLKTAKQIGVTIPPNVLMRADRVIR